MFRNILRMFLERYFPATALIETAATDTELRAFFKAVSDGSLAEVEEALEHDPGLVNRKGLLGYSAIHMVDHPDFAEKLDLLIANGVDINAQCDKGTTLAHGLEDPKVLPDLIRHGADLNARCRQGCTPLMEAMAEPGPHSRAMVEALLEAGADPSSVDDHGFSVLDHALEYDMSEEDNLADLIREALARQGK